VNAAPPVNTGVVRGWPDALSPRARVGLTAWMILAVGLFASAGPPPTPAPVLRGAAAIVPHATKSQDLARDVRVPWNEAKGHLAIVIDDIGRELEITEPLLELPYALTFAILPGSSYARGVQTRILAAPQRPREVFVHLPMEPLEPALMHQGREGEEEFLLLEDSRAQLEDKLEAALRIVPSAVGINNHMGSKLTADREAMDALMAALARRKLAFLDSRTHASTQAEASARAHGLLSGARQVFLDHDKSAEAIAARFDEAAALSLQTPTIAIGHPSLELLTVLRERLPLLEAQKIGIYSASRILRAQGTTPPR